MNLGLVETGPLAVAAAAAVVDDTSASGGVAAELLAPILVLLLCVVAGVGTCFLLPGRRSTPAARSLGGSLVLLAGLTLVLLLIRSAVQYSGSAGPGIYFWIFSVIALVGALRVVTHPRPVYAALYFVLTVFATAGLFILLWAEFMAVALVLIYAGAILVTYLFVIMLAASTMQTGLAKLAEYDQVSRDPIIASAVGFALMGVLLFVVFDRAQPITAQHRSFTYVATKTEGDRTIQVEEDVDAPSAMAARATIPEGLSVQRGPETAYSIQALGRYLFGEQSVNLELSGLILTLGMVGAILIARRRVIVPQQQTPWAREQEVFTAPATPVSDDPYSIPVYGTDNPRQKAYPET